MQECLLRSLSNDILKHSESLKTHLLLQVLDLQLITCILLHPVSSHVSQKLHSDPQIDHQVHLVVTALANTSAGLGMLELTANVWSDVVLDACDVLVVQRFVVGDLDIALGNLVFELKCCEYEVIRGWVERNLPL